MFEDFVAETISTSDADIRLVRGGSGPPVLLLHGAPQTHAMWHAIGPALASSFTVVATDLRGYGDSSKPSGGDDHAAYSFRAMAADQVEVMGALGFDRFAVVGHDRGARVTHRLILDNPERVTRAAVLDIVPTDYLYAHVTRELATAYWHWFTFIQPAPLPETMIAADATAFLHWALGAFGSSGATYHPDALKEYERCFNDPAMIHALCEDYRAGASIDLEHDAQTRDQRIRCPLLVAWGAHSVVGTLYDPTKVWSDYAVDVTSATVDAGHFLVEQNPDETLQALETFLSA